jgi:hypothetical protein
LSPKGRTAHEYTLCGVFDKAFPNFQNKKKPPFNNTNAKNGMRTSSLDPNFTTYKPYGYMVMEDPKITARLASHELLEIEEKIYEDIRKQKTHYAGKVQDPKAIEYIKSNQ